MNFWQAHSYCNLQSDRNLHPDNWNTCILLYKIDGNAANIGSAAVSMSFETQLLCTYAGCIESPVSWAIWYRNLEQLIDKEAQFRLFLAINNVKSITQKIILRNSELKRKMWIISSFLTSCNLKLQ